MKDAGELEGDERKMVSEASIVEGLVKRVSTLENHVKSIYRGIDVEVGCLNTAIDELKGLINNILDELDYRRHS